eukprot:476435-Hanusia_phi.AAC.1
MIGRRRGPIPARAGPTVTGRPGRAAGPSLPQCRRDSGSGWQVKKLATEMDDLSAASQEAFARSGVGLSSNGAGDGPGVMRHPMVGQLLLS